MKKFTLLFFSLSVISICNAQSKYNWAKHAISDGGVLPVATAVDAAGNVYTAGTFTDETNFDPSGTQTFTPIGEDDIYLTKYDATGNLLWVRTIGDTPSEDLEGMALDALGNVYITGNFQGTLDFDPGPDAHPLTATNWSNSNFNPFIVKLDTDGEYVWAKSFTGGSVESNAIAVDAAGNVYTTGFLGTEIDMDPGVGVYNLGALNNNSLFISKLNTDGDFVWAKDVLNGGTGYAIAVDALGNVYTSGTLGGTADFDPGPGNTTLTGHGDNTFFLKLDASGDFVWAKQLSGPSNFTIPSAIAVDASGALYATGYFDDAIDFDFVTTGIQTLHSAGGIDSYIVKLDALGNFVWATHIGDAADDYGADIQVDAAGNVYATGNFDGIVSIDIGTGTFDMHSNGNADVYILKYAPDGTNSWAASFGDTGDDTGFSLAVTTPDKIYLSGIFHGTVDFNSGPLINNLSAPNTGAFLLQLIPATSLPLTLLNFEVVDNNTTVQLQWKTTREENMAGFTIERSANGKQFETIGSTAVNNSFDLVNNYAFTDAHPLTTTSFYRLKINDENGSFKYSRTIPVKRQGNAQHLQVSPNPAANVLYVQIDAHEAITLQIADVTGHVVYQQSKNINGNTTFPVSIQHLPAGNYYFIMKGKTIQKTQQFLKR